MQSVNRFALKEWAAVCAALADGRQSLMLRTGGIAEEAGRFRVEHDEFWLYPTRFHQQPGELIPQALPLLEQAQANAPAAGTIQLALYAVVHEVHRITEATLLPRLNGLHVLAPETVQERFDYRQPGLYAITVRVYRRDEPFELGESPHFAGCKSWVDLRNKLPTTGLTPVLTDDDFEVTAARIHDALA